MRIMIRIGHNLAATVLLLCASSCMAVAQARTIQADFTKPDAEIAVTQWRLVGPFRFAEKDLQVSDPDKLPVGLNIDYLSGLGQKEASIDAASFSSLKATPDCGLTTGPISANSDTNILDLATGGRRCEYAVAYVAAVIESPRDQDIVIAAGADDNLKMWMNGEEILADPVIVHRFIKKFGHVVGARLKKGHNFLLVKVGNLTGDWRLIVTLFPHDRAVDLAQENAIDPILVENVVRAPDTIQLHTDLLSARESATAQISDVRHQVLDSWKLGGARTTTKDISGLGKNMVYFCRVTSGGRTIERPFFYGDINVGFAKLRQRIESANTDDDFVTIALHAQSTRLKHLLEPESRSSEAWGQKVAASFAELEQNLNSLAQGSETFRHAAGTHLRGYRSSVDNQILNYWIHVPEQAEQEGKPLPLVVVLPWTALENLPFLESAQIASFEEAERYRILGDEYQLVVLQVWGRGKNLGGTAIWKTDVLEAIDAASRDYAIDQNRIYLVGDCEGGRQALLLGERYPNRFAGIAVEGPISLMQGRSRHFAPWLQYSSPITSVANLANTPVFISHEVYGQPPAQESELFVSKARAAGVDAALVRTTNGFHGFSQNPMGVKRSLFEFLKGKQLTSPRGKNVVQADLPRFGAGYGPVEDAFGTSVLIVEGTTGTANQRMAVHSLTEEVLSEWKRAYFVECPRKLDVDVSGLDMKRYNLIFIGDRDTNTWIQQMAANLPLSVTQDQISIAGKIYEGSQLGYEFISTNSLSPDKYIVVIGMNHWGPLNGWKVHPSKDGIADYMIFDLKGPSPRLRDAGYYDETVWSKLMASQTKTVQPAP